MKSTVLMVLVAGLALSSCHGVFSERIRGNGNVKTENRSAGDFTGVDVSGEIDVYVKKDSVRSIRVEADENLLEFIEVYNQNGKVKIHEKDGYNLVSHHDIKVYVSGPEFRNLEASGACSIFSENQISSANGIDIDLSGSCNVNVDIKSPVIDADLSGACEVELRGETKELKVGGSGSSDIKCLGLLAETVDIDISGAGEAEVFASQKLNVEVSGSGDVRYKGNASVTQAVSGSGSVKKLD